MDDGDKLPIKMLNDRILVRLTAEGERQSSGGILIPATAELKKRLIWAEVFAAGPSVRAKASHSARMGSRFCRMNLDRRMTYGISRVRV